MNKTWLYDVPGDYTFDTDKIEVSGGLAKLKEDLTNVYARYHLNEATGANVPDSSGNNRNGTCINMEDSDWIAGKLNNCLQFDGINEVVNFTSSINPIGAKSIECWIKTSVNNIRILGNNGETTVAHGVEMAISADGKVSVLSSQGTGGTWRFTVEGVTNVVNGMWNHIVFTWNGTINVNAVKLYINGNIDAQGTANTIETISATYIMQLGNVGNSSAPYFNGYIDEVIVYDKELTQAEVTYKYNSGNGRENEYYYSDKPTIEPTDLFDPTFVKSWDSFLETLGGGNEGSIGYNLYKVDKVNKYYWNGSVWIAGGDSDHYNSQAVVNANINAFDASPDKIGFIAYLISDGEQKVELDENQITYTSNQDPLVNAGSNKTCKDNQSIAPFSDCSFSDPDGIVIKAEYKVDGEVDTWSQIPLGGYGTLLEAVQAWTYQFANIGVKTVRLRVTDDASGDGATSEDNLEVTVSKYTVIFNVKDSTGAHVSDFYFLDGDGSMPQLKSSPFTYEYNYKATPYDTVFYKDDYVTDFVAVESIDHTENVILAKTVYKETSRIYHPIRINISNKKSIIKTLVKGDTILFEVKVDANITDWKIRAHIWDSGSIDIKKATSNSGGSDFEIEVTDVTGGVFIVKINKGETTNIANQANLEIELETNEGKIYTVYQSILKFVTEKIKWQMP